MKTIHSVELNGVSKQRWTNTPPKKKEALLALPFIERIVGHRLFFQPGWTKDDTEKDLDVALRLLLKQGDVIWKFHDEAPEIRLARLIAAPETFPKLRFGSDVAEDDHDLMHYFVSTPSFQSVLSRQKSVVIGPKGSGKSAILKAIVTHSGINNAIVITPEIFATSMLKQFVEKSASHLDEEEAFVSTWIFTILIEVFKRFANNTKGIPSKALKGIREYLKANTQYQDMDIFTRFIGYLKRIESVKVGSYELTVKTRMLQDLYALEGLYALIPTLRDALKDDILILIDELDQGWDNSPHSNKFLAALLQAAIRIQRLGLNVHVVVFIRSEIFDLVKYQLDQLDKLRSSIDVLSWSPSELGTLVLKRIGHSLDIEINNVDFKIINEIFGDLNLGFSGFDYILSRTTKRPREVLQFMKHAHSVATQSRHKRIMREDIIRAEEDFSGWKIEHICTEYKYIFPKLRDLLWAFRTRGPVLSTDAMTTTIKDYHKSVGEAELPQWARVPEREIIQQLFAIEFIGVERPRSLARNSSGILLNYEFAYERPSANVKNTTSFLVHPAFWRVLELNADGS